MKNPCVVQTLHSNYIGFNCIQHQFTYPLSLFLLCKVVSREPFQKPVPKPRSKAPGKPIQPDKTPKAVAWGISQTVERHRASSDDSCSESLSPTQENLHSLSGERNPDETGDTQPASCDGHSLGGSDNGNLNTTPRPLLVP